MPKEQKVEGLNPAPAGANRCYVLWQDTSAALPMCECNESVSVQRSVYPRAPVTTTAACMEKNERCNVKESLSV